MGRRLLKITNRKSKLVLSMQVSRQWPEVYDLCHSFLQVARVKARVKISLKNSRNVQKRATKSDSSGHRGTAYRSLHGFKNHNSCATYLATSLQSILIHGNFMPDFVSKLLCAAI